jgi:hypothetical protein
LLRRLKKPSRNDDNLRRFNFLNSPVINIDFYKIIIPQDDNRKGNALYDFNRLWTENHGLETDLTLNAMPQA